MIYKPINEVDVNDLQSLIENEVREGKTIEYKREMTIGKADSEVVPFLKAVSSFANTVGGDLFIGIDVDKENKDMPTALPGIVIDNLDTEKLRLENMLRDGLEPRLPSVNIQPIPLEDGKYVLMIRVQKSWVAPHRVKRNDKFYARNSSGCYPLGHLWKPHLSDDMRG